MLRIGWFSTGRGEGSRGLLRFVHERLSQSGVDARIGFVFSNREPGEAEGSDAYFRLVREYEIPLVTLSSARFRRERGGRFAALRADYDRLVMDRLADRNIDICVLAGYMLIVGGEMCQRYPLLNLHPALPDGPIGAWQEVVWQLIEQRAPQTGAMVHLATEEVDRGPVVSYVTVPLTGPAFESHWEGLASVNLAIVKANRGEGYPLFQMIRREQYAREPYLLLETLRALSEGDITVDDGVVRDARGAVLTGPPYPGICLDRQIEESMKREEAGG